MRNVDPLIEVDFEDSVFITLLKNLKPRQHLTAAMVLTALDEDGNTESFEYADFSCVPFDISDLPKATLTGELGTRLRLEQQLAAEGKLLTGLEENDPLRLYLEEIAAIPVCGDIAVLEKELFAATLAEREAPELWQKLLNLSLSRIVQIACEYTGYGVQLMDLIQEGSMGLWQNMPRFCGDDFEAMRDHFVRYAMKKLLILQAYANGVGQKMRQAMEDYRNADEQLLTDLGRNPTQEEIAEALHMDVEAVASIKEMIDSARLMHRAKAEPEPDPQEEEQAVEDTAYFQMRQRISDLLSTLDETDVQLLTLRFGLEGGLPLSPDEAGKRLHLTAPEVVAREAAALAKLRKEG